LAAGEKNRSRYNQGGNRRLWFFLNNGLIAIATQTETNDKHFSKKKKRDSILHGNPLTWVHDIGPVGYAGRK